MVMKALLKYSVFVVFVFFYSCENVDFLMNVDCTQCVRVEPIETRAVLEFSTQYGEVPFVIYKGDYESGDIILQDTIISETYEFDLDVDANYTIAAEYTLSDKKITVVDGEFIEKRLAASECSLDCWVVLGGDFDLTLKY